MRRVRETKKRKDDAIPALFDVPGIYILTLSPFGSYIGLREAFAAYLTLFTSISNFPFRKYSSVMGSSSSMTESATAPPMVNPYAPDWT